MCVCGVRVCVYLRSVGQEEGAGQVAGDATEDVDDGDADPASQLLQIPQDGHLEHHRNRKTCNTQSYNIIGS